jgi:CRP-like cAMP-binding protein
MNSLQTQAANTKTPSFYDSVAHFVKMSKESKKALMKIMVKQELPKGKVLVSFEQACNSVYYIEKGLARSYYLKDGKEITERFSKEAQFCCSIVSYITGKTDHRQIELLENSIIWTTPYVELEKLYNAHHDVERLGRYINSLELVDMHERLNNIQFESAPDRYKHFITAHPALMQRVPLGMIASYLGITQETLSRIRSQVI